MKILVLLSAFLATMLAGGATESPSMAQNCEYGNCTVSVIQFPDEWIMTIECWDPFDHGQWQGQGQWAGCACNGQMGTCE